MTTHCIEEATNKNVNVTNGSNMKHGGNKDP